MRSDCVVFGCRNSSTSLKLQTKKNDCVFFPFPLGQHELVEKWLQKLFLEGWSPGPENVVCEEHFSFDSIEICHDKRILKSNAVPNLVDELDQIIINSRNILYDELNEKEDTSHDENEELRCRICAKYLTQKNAIPIYSDEENVLEKMMACIPILVKADDTLPKQICRVCLADLNISYSMLVRAIESEKLFNNLLNRLQEKSDSEDIFIDEEKQTNYDGSTMCAICNIYFEEISSLSKHFLEEHANESDFINEAVVIKAKKKEDTTGESIYNSVIDEEPEKLTTDDEYDCNERQWICGTCDSTFTSREILTIHIESFHKVRELNCDLKDHVYSPDVHDTTTIVYVSCQFCDLTFDSEDALNEHIETHIESMMCDVCGFMCEDYQKMLKHRDIHTNKKRISSTCGTCFIVFPSRVEMMQHTKKMHPVKSKTRPKKWVCKYCGKETNKKLSLAIHERVHTGARPFVCEMCGRSFKSKANLIQHQPIHTGEKRYNCTICDKAFSRKSFVHTHMRVHTGERPFRCDICGKSYTQIGDMRRHRKRHTRKEESFDEREIEKYISILQSRNSGTQSDNDEKPVSHKTNEKQLNGGCVIPTMKSFNEGNLLPTMPSLDVDKFTYEEDVDSEKFSSVDNCDVFQNNSLIKLHFAKDISDFRRILVELQQ